MLNIDVCCQDIRKNATHFTKANWRGYLELLIKMRNNNACMLIGKKRRHHSKTFLKMDLSPQNGFVKKNCQNIPNMPPSNLTPGSVPQRRCRSRCRERRLRTRTPHPCDANDERCLGLQTGARNRYALIFFTEKNIIFLKTGKKSDSLR